MIFSTKKKCKKNHNKNTFRSAARPTTHMESADIFDSVDRTVILDRAPDGSFVHKMKGPCGSVLTVTIAADRPLPPCRLVHRHGENAEFPAAGLRRIFAPSRRNSEHDSKGACSAPCPAPSTS